jgi:hypothetical protein
MDGGRKVFIRIARRSALPTVVAVLFAMAAVAQLTEVRLPTTQQTQITDCITPTTLTLPGGATITLKGGQFIHYEDAFFKGTMYASSSAAGCQQFASPLAADELGRPVTQVLVTFSKPVPRLELTAYNIFSQDQAIGVGFNSSTGQGGGSAGNEFLSYEMQTFRWPPPPPWPQAPTASFSVQTFTQQVQPDFTHRPTAWSWGLTSLKIPQDQPDRIEFDYSGSPAADGKILISARPSDADYFSRYQVAGASPSRVKISGTLISGATNLPKSGSVYLKVDDPPDSAPYRGGDSRTGDNDGPAATLEGGTPLPSGATLIQTDAQGHFEIPLQMSSRVAGDNYQIEGSPDADFQCGTNCAKSGIFTLWKRLYVEEEHMFRRGTFLRDEATAGATVIPVDDPGPFQGLAAGAVLELVHGETNGLFYFDFVTFRTLRQNPDGTWSVLTSDRIPRYYGMPSNGAPLNPVLGVTRDGVGVVDAATYAPNTTYTKSLYDTMFVDVRALTSTVEEVPYVRELAYSSALFYASRWLQHGAPAANGFTRSPEPNVLHRIGASQMPLAPGSGGCYGPQLGATVVAAGTNFSFILEQRIADLGAAPAFDPICHVNVGMEYLGAPAFAVSGEVTAHETTHFWVHSARTSSMDSEGHCVAERYEHDGLECLLHVPYVGVGLYDGRVDLHYESHGADSEYMWVRREADPVPLQ